MRIFTLVILATLLPGLAWGAEESADLERMFRQLDSNNNDQLEADEIAEGQSLLFQRLVRTADANDDGQLSLSEFQQGLQPQRTAKPLAEKKSNRLPGADALLLLVAMCDANADGLIEDDEVPERLWPFYRRLQDRLGGGEQQGIQSQEIARAAQGLSQFALQLTKRLELDVELEIALLPEKNWQLVQRLEQPRRPGDMLADPALAMQRFRTLDANGDGQIAYEEIPEQYSARFDQMLTRGDRNGDQKISQREMERMSRRVRMFRAAEAKAKKKGKGRKKPISQEKPAMSE